MLERAEAGSQNGTRDKREAGRVGGEKCRQAEIQIVRYVLQNRQVGQQAAVTGEVNSGNRQDGV